MKCVRVVILLVLCSLYSCRQNDLLKQALDFSGDNRKELELVLNHYQSDSLKYRAACFLIENMLGAYAMDKELVSACQPFYQMYDSVSHTYDYDSLSVYDLYSKNRVWGNEIERLWKTYAGRHAVQMEQKACFDLHTLKASQLIAYIEQAFKAWKGNVYTRNYSFDTFCNYILPYRQENGLLLDEVRKEFYDRHHSHFFSSPGKDMIQEADSLLRLYSFIGHSGFHATDIPIWDVATLEKLRHGLCSHKCWHNTLLFSALGLAAATDFVPAWANRGSSHSWSVLIDEEDIHPFNPFWEKDLWQYKQLYNNQSCHEYWGRFRLPKVFRKTYKCFLEGPLADGVCVEDIPPVFRSVKMKDVSHEYFDTVHVRIPLCDVPDNVKYAYLCVWNYNEWKPVHWGKISLREAVFYGMGKEAVYLPVYYIKGKLVPASCPVWVRKDGSQQFLSPAGETEDMLTVQFTGVVAYLVNRYNNGIIAGTSLRGANEVGHWGDTFCVFSDRIELNSQFLNVNSKDSVRYIQMQLPSTGMALGKLYFYKKTVTGMERLKHVRWLTPLPASFKGESAESLFDEWSATGYRMVLEDSCVCLDLGESCRLSQVQFCPYLDVEYQEGQMYELCFWKDGWQVFDTRKGGGMFHFKEVPKNTLWLIRPIDYKERKHARPFLYLDGEVYWF